MRSTHRALAVVLTLLLLWTGSASAVHVTGKAVEASGAPVANAKFVAVIDDGETSALRVTRTRGRYTCSHPSWGDLFEVPSYVAFTARQPAAEFNITPEVARRISQELQSAFQTRTGKILDRIEV